MAIEKDKVDVKKVLITGVTGSLGRALVDYFSKRADYRVIGISRDPHKQLALKQAYPEVNLVLLDIANIENYQRLKRVCEGADALIHTAALKVVSLGESHPEEVQLVNVVGSRRVAEAWNETGKSRPAVAISTDKAVDPINFYGRSKAQMETLFRVSNYSHDHDFSVVRYGNVVASNGSFLHVWARAIKRGDPIKVVQYPVTRFCMTMDEAVALVTNVLSYVSSTGKNGIFVPTKLKSFYLHDVRSAVIKHTGSRAQYIDIGAGEKIHEDLLSQNCGVEPITPEIGRVFEPDWSSFYEQFNSKTAEKISGEDLLKLAQWERILDDA